MDSLTCQHFSRDKLSIPLLIQVPCKKYELLYSLKQWTLWILLPKHKLVCLGHISQQQKMSKTKGINWISHVRLVLNLIMKAWLTECKVFILNFKTTVKPPLWHLLQTLIIKDSFLGLAPYIFLKLTHLIRTLSNMDSFSGSKGICNNGVDCSFHWYANKTNFHAVARPPILGLF